MPKPRKSSLETPTARRKLAVRKGSYFIKISPGISLGYRRNQGAGVWSVRATDGHGAEWLKKIGIADDLEPAAPPLVLNYWEAINVARKLARTQPGTPDDDSRPLTVEGALTSFERDLEARGANTYNAKWPRRHLTTVLLSKPVSLLSSKELRKWRDSLLGKVAPSSINRLCGSISAAFNLAASHDQRIKNHQAWEIGLQALPDADEDRNVILSDDKVLAFVGACNQHNAALGLFADTMAQTGSRPSQIARLLVADLVADPAKPKLLMPKSAKGGGRNRVARKAQRVPVPITPRLADRLAMAAKRRAADAPLLLQSDATSWGKEPSQRYRADVRAIVADLGWDADEVTLYSLRHSSIVRQLLANVPVRVVASTHDTSVAMIEKHYSRFIADHSDEHTRRALLQPAPAPVADNVTVLVG
jgi:integrase